MRNGWRVLKALCVAWWAHRKQRDKAGAPYVRHLARVAWVAYGLTRDAQAAVVGLLHDYIEDVDRERGAATIARRFGMATARACEVLTRQRGEGYRSYIERVGATADRIALAVKIADLLHNTDPTRRRQGPVKGVAYGHSAAHLAMRMHDKRETYLQALALLVAVRAEGLGV